MTRILLLRHGATDVMRHLLAGRAPGIPLNLLGRKQVGALAARLPPVDLAVSSPIDRALETATAVAQPQRLQVRTDLRFTEFDFGEWTGRTFEDLASDPRWNEFNRLREATGAPGGESMAQVQFRAVTAVQQLAKQHRGTTLAIVSHADVIRSIVLDAAQTGIQNYWKFRVEAASITELEIDGDRTSIVRVNDTAHLEHLNP